MSEDCDHAARCDICNLYFCANDELIMCRSCFGPTYCAECFCVKDQDPVRYEWYCDKKQCMEMARKTQKTCSSCKNNCIKHKKVLSDGEYMCRRCIWWSNKRKGK
jgi:hypothetical protein